MYKKTILTLLFFLVVIGIIEQHKNMRLDALIIFRIESQHELLFVFGLVMLLLFSVWYESLYIDKK